MPAVATGRDDALGYWLTQEQDGAVEFAKCPGNPAWLCGFIVWDKDATRNDPGGCGKQIAQLMRFERDTWTDGWAIDPRTDKRYHASLKLDSRHHQPVLLLRAFVGVELFGETEVLTRVPTVPAGCKNGP